MLIKEADDQGAAIAELERLANGHGSEARRAGEELRKRRAGLKGEADSAYLIDFNYAHSPNWAVIHDLRLEHGGRVAQIDHLLINRWMDVYVLETKHFRSGVKITPDGEFLRWNDYRRNFEGMASPLEQNERHIAVLRDVMDGIEMPVRIGIRIPPSFHSFVLVAPQARIDRARGFDASRVIKADQLKARIWKDVDDENGLLSLLKAAKIVSGETLEFVARQVAERHRPAPRPATHEVAHVASPAPAPTIAPTPAPTPTTAVIEADAPKCKQCAGTQGSILYGNSYYFKCGSCGTNTSMRPTCQPGHKPRLRKSKQEFFRECPECGTSVLFYRNPDSPA
jgi:hypothetical protein